MPHRPYWHRRIPDILHWAEAISDPVLDRKAIEALFGISQSEAQRVIKRIGGFRLAGAMVVSRWQLVDWLRRLKKDDAVIYERGRFQKLEETLEKTRKDLAARKIRIQADPDARNFGLENLPAGVHLRPGELKIEFFGTEDLMRHLFELSQIITNDFHRVQSLIEE